MINLAGFQLQNPWRSGQFVPTETYRRNLLGQVLSWLNDPEIIAIIGSRQVGKTTLLNQVIEHLLAQGIHSKDIFYFNLDDPSLLNLFDDTPAVVSFVESHKIARAYIFIDEVQRLQNPGLFLKYVYDLKRDFKLVVTGSSSLEIRAKISESLTGRKVMFEMFSFGFSEFIASRWNEFVDVTSQSESKGRHAILTSISKLQNLHGASFEKWFMEYLTYGGYPKVVMEPDLQRKLVHLKEVFTSYIQKDVKDFFEIENVTGYNNLIKVLAEQIGSLVNVSELANTLGLHKATTEKYLSLLEATYQFKRVTPFFQNVRRELTKMPKIYALDTGMRNFAVSNFGDMQLRADRGEVAENFVFTELLRVIEPPHEIHFWRTQTQAEVDFILELAGKIIPVEVKFTPMKSPRVSKSFRSFLAAYHPEVGLVLTKDFTGEMRLNGAHLLFLPLWSLLFFEPKQLLEA